MGALSCNPFELVKTRLQSASSSSLAVGHQHGYSAVWNALSSIYKKDGVKGLYRGSVLSMGRSIVGSGANLTSYSLLKEHLTVERHWKDGVLTDMVCGMASGLVSWLTLLTQHIYEPNRCMQDEILQSNV
jgi:Mitochondrial carrier protein